MNTVERIRDFVKGEACLGYEEMEDGTFLGGRVLHVAPNAYLHAIYPPLKEKDIDFIEKGIGRDLPSSLRELYLMCNGLDFFSGALSVFGLRKKVGRSLEAAWQPYSIFTPNVDERINNASPGIVFFGAYDWDGSLVYVSDMDNRVFRCSRESTKPLNIWSDVDVFLLDEVRRLAKLFSKNGEPLDESVPTVPLGEKDK